MAEDHAFLAPSSASTWGPGGCPAYPRMAQQFPEDGESLSAREGTAAHWYISEVIRGRPCAEGAVAPNGHPVTAEMIECAGEMLADMRKLIGSVSIKWAVEQRLKMSYLGPMVWGTGDFGAVDLQQRVLYAWDFKFGHGYVDAFENWQLVCYLVGLAEFFHVTLDSTWQIDARIYQPRSFHKDGPVKVWEPSISKFFELREMLKDAAYFASQPDADTHTGDHCTYCSARHACPALQKVVGHGIDVSMQGVPHVLTTENAGILLRILRASRERLEEMETGIEAQIQAAIRKGETCPGWRLQPSEGREKWTQDVETVISMGALFGVDLRKPPEAITPAQARKKGIDGAVISEYAERPVGATKLVAVEDKDIRKAFNV